ncbi:MAG TPA: Mur ligase family protein, partial [Thermoanaerobaculia bacterium]
EYNAAFFDRGPKFLHYEPRQLFVGNIEYDHADLYPDIESIEDAFRKVIALVPPDGAVVINADDKRVVDVARHARSEGDRHARSNGDRHARSEDAGDARATVVRVSLADPGADFSARDVAFHEQGTDFTLLEAGLPTARLSSPLLGLHNVRNALGAIALVRGAGLSASEIAAGLPRFAGVRRRLEVKGEKNGILVVDDFAHHPTAVSSTLEAARARFPARRIWALFEPRSNTAGRKMFEDEYAEAFAAADALVLAPVYHARRLAEDARLDRDALVRRFHASGKPAFAPEAIAEIPEILRREARPGDVLLLMSSGAFGGLPETLLESL